MTIVPEGFDPYLADALLLLAADEGQNLNSYARMSGASKSVMASYFGAFRPRDNLVSGGD